MDNNLSMTFDSNGVAIWIDAQGKVVRLVNEPGHEITDAELDRLQEAARKQGSTAPGNPCGGCR
jgi:hypothetical protein